MSDAAAALDTSVAASSLRELAERWAPPVVDGRVVERNRSRVTAADLQGIERAAWDEGHARGREEGLAAGATEIRKRTDELDARVRRLDGLLELLAAPLEALDPEIERQLVTLALTVAKHVVRRELRTDPEQIIGILRETLALLPAAARDVRVHVNPQDAAIINERLSAPSTVRAWTLVEDPSLARGGCRVTTDNSQIDARLESRLNAAVAQILGEERAADSREPA